MTPEEGFFLISVWLGSASLRFSVCVRPAKRLAGPWQPCGWPDRDTLPKPRSRDQLELDALYKYVPTKWRALHAGHLD
jgi:hypothetical protein